MSNKPTKRAKQLQASAAPKSAAAANSAELEPASAAEIQPAANTTAALEPPPSSPLRGTSGNAPPNTSKFPAKSPAKSPARVTKNSSKPPSLVGASVVEVVEYTAEDGGSPSEEGGSTLQATTAKASKKRKVDNSAAHNVGSSSSETARVREKIDRLGDFANHLDHSDDESKMVRMRMRTVWRLNFVSSFLLQVNRLNCPLSRI